MHNQTTGRVGDMGRWSWGGELTSSNQKQKKRPLCRSNKKRAYQKWFQQLGQNFRGAKKNYVTDVIIPTTKTY